jgi:hypothetical protein
LIRATAVPGAAETAITVMFASLLANGPVISRVSCEPERSSFSALC